MRSRVPRIERVLADAIPDGRLLLQIKDAPFDNPILARFASDGTLKMLAYLVLLYDPTPPPFIGSPRTSNAAPSYAFFLFSRKNDETLRA